jgi:AcrR family transcriptional regulator
MAVAGQSTRSDARRNRDTVINAAIELLGENPNASMQEVAAASGLGRTTVYRHFPSRETLLVSLFERVVEEAQRISASIIAEDGGAELILRRMGREFVLLGGRFRFLSAFIGETTVLEESKIAPHDPVADFIRAGQASGELVSDLPQLWVQSMLQAMSIAATDDVAAGRFDATEAGELLGDSFVALLLPR